MQPIHFITIVLIVTATVTSATASPAAWYIWKSKINHLEVCSQTNLGEGWEKWKGPFKDAQCRLNGKPGEVSELLFDKQVMK